MTQLTSTLNPAALSKNLKCFKTTSDIHSHNTRYASNLNFHVPRVRSNYGKHTFKFAITKTWEEIPTKIKTLSYHKFKKEYKRILVNSQR